MTPSLEKEFYIASKTKQLIVEQMATSLHRSQWYCPDCGQGMFISEPNMLHQVCLSCGLKIPGRIIYRIVELHPHS